MGREYIFPKKKLGARKYAPNFKDVTFISNLECMHYRRPSDCDQSDSIKFLNYNNYQYISLIQNIDDMTQDVIKTKGHLA